VGVGKLKISEAKNTKFFLCGLRSLYGDAKGGVVYQRIKPPPLSKAEVLLLKFRRRTDSHNA